MKKISIDKLTDLEIKELSKEDERLTKMFYKVKEYANMEMDVHTLDSYLKRNKFLFSIMNRGTKVFLNVVDKVNNVKYCFSY